MDSETSLRTPALPVRDPVTNYEKIKRIGEGTYGVVCTPSEILQESAYQLAIGVLAVTSWKNSVSFHFH